jgi:DNA-binding CsgD family transcriptional regulator
VILALVDPGDPPRKAPTYRVQCPVCERVYETVAYERDLVTRARCRRCSDARRTAKKKPAEERAPALPDMTTAFACGTSASYVKGCRCEPCTDANRVYARAAQKLARMGQGNPLVSSAPARRHIEKLAADHVGTRQIADAAQTSRSTVIAVLRGTKLEVRRKTAEKILAVTNEAKADAAFVDATHAWRIIARLLADGFTQQEIAGRLGSKAKTPALQLKGDRILLRNEAALERLYRQIHGKDAPRGGRPLGSKNQPRESAEAVE